jgi:hypothetical protein
MLHHISIAVAEPVRVAKVLAELMGGRFFEFPIHPGSYMVMAGDDRGTAIEILPKQAVLVPGTTDVEFQEVAPPQFHSVHAAISVPVSQETIEQIGLREGWLTRYCDRGPFEVIEFWVENVLLLELIAPHMTKKYLDFMHFDVYESFLNSVMSASAA